MTALEAEKQSYGIKQIHPPHPHPFPLKNEESKTNLLFMERVYKNDGEVFGPVLGTSFRRAFVLLENKWHWDRSTKHRVFGSSV